MNLGGCEVGKCEANASVTYLDHGVCEGHWNEFTAEEAAPDALRMALGVDLPTTLPMEETMRVPKAGTRRGKRSGESKSATKATPAKQTITKKEKAPRESQVVFAFRLSQAERDRIHEASGPGGATQFVRAAALAAANRDTKVFEELVAKVKSSHQ